MDRHTLSHFSPTRNLECVSVYIRTSVDISIAPSCSDDLPGETLLAVCSQESSPPFSLSTSSSSHTIPGLRPGTWYGLPGRYIGQSLGP